MFIPSAFAYKSNNNNTIVYQQNDYIGDKRSKEIDEFNKEEIEYSYADDHVIIKLADTPLTRSLSFYPEYSEKAVYKEWVAVESADFMGSVGFKQIASRISAVKRSTSSIKSILDFKMDFSEMRLINPSMKTIMADGTYQITETKNNTFVIYMKDLSVEEALEILNNNPAVEYARRSRIFKPCATPIGPLYNDQWALQRINAPQAWNYMSGGTDVVVGIMDSGIDGTHPDLENIFWNNPSPNQGIYNNDIHGYDFVNNEGGIPTDSNGHGTHVAGIVAAMGNNAIGNDGTGLSGANWNVKLAWLGIPGYETPFCVDAFNYAEENNIPIVNCSWGTGEYLNTYDFDEDPLYAAIKSYVENGGLVIASAGNTGWSTDENIFHYPAGLGSLSSEYAVRQYYIRGIYR